MRIRKIPNRKLTDNFTLHEFVEARLPKQGVDLNWKHYDQFNESEYQKLANFLQDTRSLINDNFRHLNGGREIGLTITSGFRCREWELIRGRDGTSQHCVGEAVDIQPVFCSDGLAVDIMKWLYDLDWPRETGHVGGFAVKWPTYEKGVVKKLGFLHYDMRGFVARWTYK